MTSRRSTIYVVLGLSLLTILGGRQGRPVEASEAPDRPITTEWPKWMPTVEVFDPHVSDDPTAVVERDMRIAVDSRGRAHAVWVGDWEGQALPPEMSPTKYAIFHSIHDWPNRGASGWSPPELVSDMMIDVPYRGQRFPLAVAGLDFVIDGRDDLYVAYSANYFTPDIPLGDYLCYVASVGGGAWSRPTYFSSFTLAQPRSPTLDHDAVGIGRPRMAVTGAGIHAGWTQSRAVLLDHPHPGAARPFFDHYVGDAMYSFKAPGFGFDAPAKVSRTSEFVGDNAASPHQYSDYAFGEAYPFSAVGSSIGLAWSAETIAAGGATSVGILYAPTLEDARLLPGSVTAASEPLPLSDVQSDLADKVHFLWQDSASFDLLYSRVDLGTGTPPTGPEVIEPVGEETRASLEVDSREGLYRAHAIWVRDRAVYYSGATGEMGWSAPRRITERQEMDFHCVHLTRDLRDTLHASFAGLYAREKFSYRHLRTWEDNLGYQDPLAEFPAGPNATMNVATGNLRVAIPLFASQGVGLSTGCALIYNSGEPLPGVVSNGWQTNYHVFLTATAARRPTDPVDLVLTYGDGRSVVYRFNALLGYYTADALYGDSGRIGAAFGDRDAPTGANWMMVTKHGLKHFFDGSGKLLRIADPNQNAMDFGYGGGVLTTIVDSAGRTTTLRYNGGQLAAVVDPNSRSYTLAYSSGRLTSITYAATGDTWTFRNYDSTNAALERRRGLLSRLQTPNATASGDPTWAWTFRYTPTNRVSRTLDPEPYAYERVVTYEDGSSPNATFQNRRSKLTKVSYDGLRGVVFRVEDAKGNSLRRTFDLYRNVVDSTDKRGKTTRYTYEDRTGIDQVIDNVATVRRPGAGAVAYTYTRDGLNRMATVTDARSAVTSNEYDAAGNLLAVNLPATPDNPTARQEYTYDGRGRLLTSKEPGHTVATVYGYGGDDNGTGLPVSITRPGLPPETIRYDRLGNVTRRTLPEGGATVYDLDLRYRVEKVTGPTGTGGAQSTTTTYDGDGNVDRTVTDGVGTTDPTYDRLDRLESTALPNGGVQRVLDIDQEGNVLVASDASGAVTRSLPDELDRVAFFDPPEAGSTRYTYDPNGNLEDEIEREPGGTERVTHHEYDDRNNLVLRRHPAVDGVTYEDVMEYDDNDNLTVSRRTGSDGFLRETRSDYDARNRVVLTTEVAGGSLPSRSTETHYAPNSNRVRTVDALGRETAYGFDEADRMLTVRDASQGLTRLSYDGDGNRTEVEVDGPDGGRVRTQRMRYNQAGQLLESEDAGGHVTSYAYDVAGRVLTRTGPVGPSPQATVEYEYYGPGSDGAGQVRFQKEYPEAAGGAMVVTEYRYDRNGNRTDVIDARGKAYRYEFDERNRLKLVTYPGGTQESLEYDDLGNLFARTDANGRRHEFDHDGLNRLTKERHYGSPAEGGLLLERVLHRYDGAGNELGVESLVAGIRKETQYNAFNEPTRVEWFVAGEPWRAIEHPVYDAAGNRRRTIGPEGEVYDYGFDASNRMTSVTRTAPGGSPAPVAEWEYDRAGRRRRVGLGNGVEAWYNYDGEELLTNLRYERGGTALASWTYTYDQNHNRIGQAMDHLGASWAFGYDGMQRLVSESCTGAGTGVAPPPDPTVYLDPPRAPGNQSVDSAEASGMPRAAVPVPAYSSSWEYDGVGNRLSQASTLFGDAAYTYSDTNELLTETRGGEVTTYSYDRVGSLVRRERGAEVWTFGTDYANRIQRVTGPAGTFTYVYAPEGERVEKILPSGDERWTFYDGADAIADYSRAPGPTSTYTLTSSYATGAGIDDQLARFVGSDVSSQAAHYYLGDALGTVHQVLDASGVRENLNLANAWGEAINLGQTPGLADRFTGLAQREIDPESGLQYTRARHYDPSLGRFVQREPIQALVVRDHYRYAKDAPLDAADPSGLTDWRPPQSAIFVPGGPGRVAVSDRVRQVFAPHKKYAYYEWLGLDAILSKITQTVEDSSIYVIGDPTTSHPAMRGGAGGSSVFDADLPAMVFQADPRTGATVDPMRNIAHEALHAFWWKQGLYQDHWYTIESDVVDADERATHHTVDSIQAAFQLLDYFEDLAKEKKYARANKIWGTARKAFEGTLNQGAHGVLQSDQLNEIQRYLGGGGFLFEADSIFQFYLYASEDKDFEAAMKYGLSASGPTFISPGK